MLLIRLLVFSALFLSTTYEVIAQPAGKTIAFVVGVQNYQEPDLNKLQYTAKDAYDVFQQLQAVTDLDLSRSRLLIAAKEDSDLPASSALPHLTRRPVLTNDEIQREYRSFLTQVKSNDQVIFYFGGHGTNQANKHLLFLPSNYSRTSPVDYLRYNDILLDIKGTLDNTNFSNVSVVFFANMCGAGTAAGTMGVDDDPDAAFVRRWLEENSLGFQKFAFFPATAKRRNTHEDENLGRSIFAHHLITGLSGAAVNAEKEITTDSLFEYLNDHIEDDLPRHPDAFDGDISIGTTRGQEALGAYLLGTSVIAVATEQDNSLMNKIAHAQLTRVPKLSHKLGGFAHVRAAQGLAANGKVALAQRELQAALQDPILPSVSREAANHLLLTMDEQPVFPTIKSYTEYLARGEPFNVLMISAESGSSRFDESKAVWIDTLESLPGHRERLEVKVEFNANINDLENTLLSAKTEIERWKTEQIEHPTSHLLIIYDGVAGFEEDTLVPVSQKHFESLAGRWPGFVVIIYTAPYGGLLVKHQILSEKKDIALFVGGIEDNAMTFSSGGEIQGTSELMAEALVTGVEDLSTWESIVEHIAQLSTEYRDQDVDWVVGTPTWIPSWSEGNQPQSVELIAREQILPLRHWPALLASGCVEEPAVQCEKKLLQLIEDDRSEINENDDLFSTLKRAAALDIAGESSKAIEAYNEFLTQLDQIKITGVVEQPFAMNAYTSAKRMLDRLTRQVLSRREGAGGKLARKVVLLRVAVKNYQTPLVVDLNRTAHDLRIWTDSMQKRFGDSLVVKPILEDPKDAESIIHYISEHIKNAGDDDLIIFLYSGRGYEEADKRFLSAAGIFLRSGTTPTHWMVDLGEIAAAAEGRWLFAVYDAQFTRPIYDADRMDTLLDKHVDSVRPIPPDSTESIPSEGTARTLESVVFGAERNLVPRLLPSEGVPSRQVHVFWDGRLTEPLFPKRACTPGLQRVQSSEPTPTYDPFEHVPYSPLTNTLLRSLNEDDSMTYRTFATKAAMDPCFSADTSSGQLVFQGDLDVPVFATGDAAEYIVYFLQDQERTELNLRTGIEIAKLTVRASREDIDRLTLSALQILLVEHQDTLPSRLRNLEERSQLLTKALSNLNRIDAKQLSVHYPELGGAVLNLRTHALRLDNKGEAARRILLEAPPEVIGRNADLLQRLIVLTEEALRSKPSDVLAQTAAQMSSLDQNASAWSSALRERWQKLASTTLRGVKEPYRIKTSSLPAR